MRIFLLLLFLLALIFCFVSLFQAGLDFLRLGQAHKLLPEIQPYSAEVAAADIKTVNELRDFYASKVRDSFPSYLGCYVFPFQTKCHTLMYNHEILKKQNDPLGNDTR